MHGPSKPHGGYASAKFGTKPVAAKALVACHNNRPTQSRQTHMLS